MFRVCFCLLILGCVSCSRRIRGHHPSSMQTCLPANPLASPERLRGGNDQTFSSTTAGSPINRTSLTLFCTMSRAVLSCGDKSTRLHRWTTSILVFILFMTNCTMATSCARSWTCHISALAYARRYMRFCRSIGRCLMTRVNSSRSKITSAPSTPAAPARFASRTLTTAPARSQLCENILPRWRN